MEPRLRFIAEDLGLIYENGILIYPEYRISFQRKLGIIAYKNILALISDNGTVLSWNGTDTYETILDFVACCKMQK